MSKKNIIKRDSVKKKLVKRVTDKKTSTIQKFHEMGSMPVDKEKNKSRKTNRKNEPAKDVKVTINLKEIKGVRVEWFDDRFYRVDVPLNLDKSFLENIPENYIERCEDHLEIFLPSFTTIYGATEPMPFLSKWRGNVGNVEADLISAIAKQKGSNIHNAVDLLLKGHAVIFRNPKTNDINDNEIEAFKKKFKMPVHILHSQEEMIQVARYKHITDLIKPIVIDTEQHLFNFKECYAGTRDQKWLIEKEITVKLNTKTSITFEPGMYVVDLKTGKTFNAKSTATQLASYAEADPESEKIVGGIGIDLNNDRKSGIDGFNLMVKTREQLQPYFEHFKDLKRVFFFDNPARPKKYELPLVITYDRKRGKK